MPVPPDYIQKTAKKVLKDRATLPPSRQAGTRVGLARANQLARGDDIGLPILKRMRSYLSRARDNYDRAKAKGLNNKTSRAIQAYNLWGGPRALSWVNSQINKLESQKQINNTVNK